MSHYYTRFKSPVGELTLVATDKHLVAVLWENEKPNRVRLPEMKKAKQHEILEKTETQLKEYFAGTRMKFELPLAFEGTGFQTKVWQSLQKIPYGKTRSYRELASKVGSPKAYRAVGSANGRNPISIIVPCHRVISSTGKLAGFAGGLKAKAYLLQFESGV